MACSPPRAKSVVMTMFGDVITSHGGHVWLGSLIALMAPFGVNDRLVRTSVFRLAEEGWLCAQRVGRRSQYALDPRAAARFERAYRRIYTPSSQSWNGRLTLVIASAGTITTEQRADLRRELTAEGFGVIAPSVFAHPCVNPAALEEVLVRLGVKKSVLVCDAVQSEFAGAQPLSELILQCWELDALSADYAQFIQSFATLPKLLEATTQLDPQEAFVIRTLAIHAFRRVQLHDPQLPLALLPARWPGKTAFELCRQIYQLTYQTAERHVLSTLELEGDAAPPSAPYLYQHFSGLV